MHKRRVVLAALAAMSAVYAEEKSGGGAMDPKAAFSRLKSLAGDWEADTSIGKVRVSYEVIAGGTALLERESGDKMPVMVTMYHLDGGRLLLTHYCAAGNQPRMQARSYNPETGELDFRFLDATNLTPGAGHMRNANFRFVSNSEFLARWEFSEKGESKEHEVWRYKRVK